jgi:nucleotide-binding universal stress UspA family protein
VYSRMLVPIDGSEPAKLALEEAIKLAHALSASMRLLHVADLRSIMTSEFASAASETSFEELRRDGERLLRNAAANVSRADIKVDTVLVDAPDLPVGDYIVRNAREYAADLIICGTHGRRGMRRLLLGSDAEYVVRHAPVPVLLIRNPDGV